MIYLIRLVDSYYFGFKRGRKRYYRIAALFGFVSPYLKYDVARRGTDVPLYKQDRKMAIIEGILGLWALGMYFWVGEDRRLVEAAVVGLVDGVAVWSGVYCLHRKWFKRIQD